MQSKFNGGQVDKRPNTIVATNHTKKEPPKEEFSDWPHGLLAIGTFGNTDLKHKQKNPEIELPQDEECSSPDFSEFTSEEVVKLQKELKKLLSKKPASTKADHHQEPANIADLPLDRFLNCPSSLEVDRTISNRFSTYSDEDEIDRTIRIILGRCKDVCEKKKRTIGKRSLAYLVKKMFVCRGGFVPTPSMRDTFQESRMEKLMRTMLTKKLNPQKASRTSSTKKYLEDYRPTSSKAEENEEKSHDKSRDGSSKWDKTDSEYIVLEI
ncbi:hypothetical protein DH2020_016287 [Rehmannia glutinosa]|uniref:Uncharacterized protein n=1 Tax=Rehmannia glutinosa TaxID=99300 RepID=A0ABR0WMP9_REHGL